MLDHRIIAFGRLKTPGLRDAFDHYLKMLRPWVAVQEVELKPLEVPDKSETTRRMVQAKEGELLLGRLADREALVLLEETGRNLSSEDWAATLQGLADSGLRSVALVVGSSLGFSENVRKRARLRVSLGAQTLPHELARVVLAEQLFRAWSILKKHPYHNAGS